MAGGFKAKWDKHCFYINELVFKISAIHLIKTQLIYFVAKKKLHFHDKMDDIYHYESNFFLCKNGVYLILPHVQPCRVFKTAMILFGFGFISFLFNILKSLSGWNTKATVSIPRENGLLCFALNSFTSTHVFRGQQNCWHFPRYNLHKQIISKMYSSDQISI